MLYPVYVIMTNEEGGWGGGGGDELPREGYMCEGMERHEEKQIKKDRKALSKTASYVHRESMLLRATHRPSHKRCQK